MRTFALVLLLCAPSLRVVAQEAPLGAQDALGSGLRHALGDQVGAWLEAGFGPGGGGADRVRYALSGELGFRLRVADDLVADASWGLTVAPTSVEGQEVVAGEVIAYAGRPTRVEPGNPVLRGLYSGGLSSSVRLDLGFGVAVPAASRADAGADEPTLVARRASEAANRAALAVRGFWSPWRWAPIRQRPSGPSHRCLMPSPSTPLRDYYAARKPI